METREDLKLLRIFLGESDKFHHKPLYEVIVFEAKKMNLAGATVLRGIMGFGKNSIVHRSKMLELSSDLPIVIEIVDAEDKINNFIKIVEKMFEDTQTGGLITIEQAKVILYYHSKNIDTK